MVRPDPMSISEEAVTGNGMGGGLGVGKRVGFFEARDRKVPHQVSKGDDLRVGGLGFVRGFHLCSGLVGDGFYVVLRWEFWRGGGVGWM